MVDGDAASFLPPKTQGYYWNSNSNLYLYFIFEFVYWNEMKWIWYVGRFLKMFLGPINVRASQKDVQLKVKEEYNSYRVCFPSLSFYLFLLFLICRILFCLFCFYRYTTLCFLFILFCSTFRLYLPIIMPNASFGWNKLKIKNLHFQYFV